MTVWDVLSRLARFWYVTLLGLLITVVLVLHVQSNDGIHRGEVRVVLFMPADYRLPDGTKANALNLTNQSLIGAAGVVARAVEGTGDRADTVSDDVTISSIGMKHGYVVRLPNSGGQWKYSFERPVLDIQSVGTSRAEAERNMTTGIARVHEALKELQDQSNVRPENRIRTRLSPSEPSFYYNAGNPKRAMGATLLLGLTGTVFAVLLAAKLRALRIRGRKRPSAEPLDPLTP